VTENYFFWLENEEKCPIENSILNIKGYSRTKQADKLLQIFYFSTSNKFENSISLQSLFNNFITYQSGDEKKVF